MMLFELYLKRGVIVRGSLQKVEPQMSSTDEKSKVMILGITELCLLVCIFAYVVV
jgi:hypothetical protein